MTNQRIISWRRRWCSFNVGAIRNDRLALFLILQKCWQWPVNKADKHITPTGQDWMRDVLVNIQEAQLPQRNSVSAAHMEGARASSPLHLRPLAIPMRMVESEIHNKVHFNADVICETYEDMATGKRQIRQFQRSHSSLKTPHSPQQEMPSNIYK